MKRFTVKPKLVKKEMIIGDQRPRRSTDKVFIGRIAEAANNERVYIETTSEHVIAIFGKRGSGKSYTMGSIVEGLSTRNSKSSISNISKKKAILLFDTLGIYQWMGLPIELNKNSSNYVTNHYKLMQKWELSIEEIDFLLFEPQYNHTNKSPTDPYPFTLNVPDLSPHDWGYLLGIDIYRDRMGQLLNEIYIKTTQEGWHKNDSKYTAPKRDYSLKDLIKCLKEDPEIREVYHPETRRALLQQLLTLDHNPIFKETGTNIEDILKPGYLTVILLHKIPNEMRIIIASALIKKLIEKRVSISEQEKHALITGKSRTINPEEYIPPCWVVIDEAQNLLPSEKRNPASELLVKLVREGRNFGVSFMFTTQQPSAMDSRILAQVDTMLIHQLTVSQDIEYVKRNLKSSIPNEIKYSGEILSIERSIRLLDVGEVLVSNTEIERAFYMEVRPRVTIHGGFSGGY